MVWRGVGRNVPLAPSPIRIHHTSQGRVPQGCLRFKALLKTWISQKTGHQDISSVDGESGLALFAPGGSLDYPLDMKDQKSHMLPWTLSILALLLGFAALPAAAQTLAVFDPERHGDELDQGQVERLGDLLAIKLVAAGHPAITPDRFREQARGMKKCRDYACRIKLARWLGAETMLITRVLQFGQACQVTAELRPADLEYTRWAAAVPTGCEPEKLMEGIEALAKKIIAALPPPPSGPGPRVRPSPAPKRAAPERRKLSAAEAAGMDIDMYLKVHARPIQACAVLHRKHGKKKLHGTLQVEFSIHPAGRVDQVRLLAKRFKDSVALGCLVEVLKGIEFPAFEGKALKFRTSLKIGR